MYETRSELDRSAISSASPVPPRTGSAGQLFSFRRGGLCERSAGLSAPIELCRASGGVPLSDGARFVRRCGVLGADDVDVGGAPGERMWW